jgi:hypothetical protein
MFAHNKPYRSRIRWLQALINACDSVFEKKFEPGEGIEDLAGVAPKQFRFSGEKDGKELVSIYLTEKFQPLGAFPTRPPKCSKFDPSYWYFDADEAQTILRLFAKLSDVQRKVKNV